MSIYALKFFTQTNLPYLRLFQNECYKRHFVDPTAGNVEDEAADVMVLFSQILLYFNVDMDKVEKIFDEKLKRTVQRIDKGWYSRHR